MPTLEVSCPGLDPLLFDRTERVPSWVTEQINGWNGLTHRLEQANAGPGAVNRCMQAVNALRRVQSTIDPQNADRTKAALADGFGKSWFPIDSREVALIDECLQRYGGNFAAGFVDYLFLARLDVPKDFWGSGDGKIMGLLYAEKIPKQGDLGPLNSLRDEWTEDQARRMSDFDKWYKSLSGEVAKLKEQYRQIESLDKPASYWGDKQRRHRLLAWVFFFVVVALTFGGGIPLFRLIEHSRSEMLAGLREIKELPLGVQTLFLVPHGLPIILAIVGLLWALRLSVRMLLCQLHLLSDAAERVIMVKTYLSLLVGRGDLEGKAAVSDENLTIILSQLFRHESTGLFPDDSGPQLPIMEVLKVAKPKSVKLETCFPRQLQTQARTNSRAGCHGDGFGPRVLSILMLKFTDCKCN